MPPNSRAGGRSHDGDAGEPVRRLRVLVISDVLPWPARDGYRLRLRATLDALAPIADIDVFVGSYLEELGVAPYPDSMCRHMSVTVPTTRLSVGLVLRTVSSPLPRRILWRDWDSARTLLDSFANPPYDLVWYSHAISYSAFAQPHLGPAIVDLDNLENFIGNGRRFPNLGELGFLAWAIETIRAGARAILNARDKRCWERLQRLITKEATATVVCSALDRTRLDAANVEVIPNGYVDPGLRTYSPKMVRRLVMVGNFTYGPNLSGAEWMIKEVLPKLRQMVPGVDIRLVGLHDERLTAISTVRGVTIVGEVDEIGPELSSARGVVVPLQTGSGTRIKVLEALAYGLPIVSTTLGCEGIDVSSGVHVLICDDPEGFAHALARVLIDDKLCIELSARGRQLYEDVYNSRSIAKQIRELVRGVSAILPKAT